SRTDADPGSGRGRDDAAAEDRFGLTDDVVQDVAGGPDVVKAADALPGWHARALRIRLRIPVRHHLARARDRQLLREALDRRRRGLVLGDVPVAQRPQRLAGVAARPDRLVLLRDDEGLAILPRGGRLGRGDEPRPDDRALRAE